MATTIDSVDLYMATLSGVETWDVHVDLHAATAYNSNPTVGSILGSSVVSTDLISTTPGWINFTFSPAITITTANFYGIHVWCDAPSSYQAAHVLMYAATDWVDATTGEPYAGKERAWYKTGTSWVSGNTRAYKINCTGCDDNVAETPDTGTSYFFYALISKGQGIRTYLEAATLSKPTTPTPETDATEVGFSDLTLSWVDGGGATAYNVYIGPSGDMTLVSEEQAETSYTTSLAELQTVFDATPINQVIYWRVDATDGDSWVTGDEWNFDARPAAVTNPTPTDTGTGISTYPTFSWDASSLATSYSVSAGLPGHLSSLTTGLTAVNYPVVSDTFSHITEYNWRIDAVNQFGTTAGTVWSFTSVRYDPPIYVSWYPATNTFWSPLVKADGSLGAGPPTGTLNVDYFVVGGPNDMLTQKKLIVFANSKVWVED